VALSTGQSLDKMGSDIIQLSYGMSKSTGVSRKKIAKDMAQIMGDFKNFGAIGAEQAAVISGKMRSLGLDIKALGKMIDKNMNFDSAAESAAQLGQAFGMALDPMKMMTKAANDPIGMLEDMRKSMFAAGKSAENMNAAEMRLLSTQTGLSAEEAKLMFSRKNRGKSAKQLKKDAKSQLTDQQKQTKATKEMAKEMAKLVEVLTTGGIFENLTQGFGNFMKQSGKLGDFQDLNEVFYEIGWKLGEVFNMVIDSGFLDAIVDVLKQMGPLMQKLMDNGFFQALVNGDFAGAVQLFGDAFSDQFGMTLMNALDSAAAYLVDNAAMIVNKFTDLLEFILAEIDNPSTTSKTAAAFGRLFSAWERFWDVIRPYIVLMLNALWDTIVQWAKDNPKIAFTLFAIWFGPAMIPVALAAASGFLLGFVQGISKNLRKNFVGMAKNVQGAFSGTFNFLSRLGTRITDLGSRVSRFIGPKTLSMWAKFTDAITKVWKWIGDLGTKISKAATEFATFANKGSRVAKFFTSLAKGAGGILKSMGPVGKVFGVVGKLIGKLLVPIVAVWNAFKRLKTFWDESIAIFDEYGQSWEGFGRTLGSFFDNFMGWLMDMADFFTFDLFDFASLWEAIPWGEFWDALMYIPEWIATAFMAPFNEVAALWAGSGTIFQKVLDSIIWFVDLIISAIIAPFVFAWELLFGATIWSGATIGKVWQSLLNMITSFAKPILDWVMKPFNWAYKGLTALFNSDTVGAIWDGILGAIEVAKDAIYQMTIGPFVEAYDYIADLLGFDSFSEIMDNITSGISAGADAIYTAFTGVFDPAIEWFKDKFGFLMPGSASQFVTDIASGITGGASAFLDEFKDMINAPIDWLKDKGSALVEGGANLVAGLSEGISSAIDDPMGALKDVGNAIEDGWNDFWGNNSPSEKMASEGGAPLVSGIAKGIEDNQSSALDSIMGLGKSLLDASSESMPDLGGMFGGIGATLSESLGEELGSMGDALSGMGLESFGLGSVKEMFKVFMPGGGLFGDVTPELLEGMITQADGILANANQLITILETIKETVEGIPEIKIDKTIDSIEKGTQVVQDFAKIKDKPLALTVTLNIKMNAEQIATELLNTDAMKVVAKV
jgi:hypothetical protein